MSKNKMDNLNPFGDNCTLSKEEQKALNSKGGKASAATRRRKKEFKEIAKLLLEIKPDKDSLAGQLLSETDIDENDKTYRTAILLAQLQKALMENDTKAAQFLIDTAGENTIHNENLQQRKDEQKQRAKMQEQEFQLKKERLEKDDW